MRHDTIEDLVLLNHALLAKAEEACARSRLAQFRSLLVSVECLMSGAYNPPWAFSALAHGAGYDHYQEIADAAWTRGLAHWRKASTAWIADWRADC